MHLLGYARVSTPGQDAALQLDALSAAGCYRTFADVASGARSDRPQLAAVLDQLRPDDTLVVWRLDRLGRSVHDLITTVGTLRDRQIGFRSLTAVLGLSIAEDWHAHDSRPGSYCRRVGPIGHRRTVHLMHDGHAMTDDHVLVYRNTAPSWRGDQPVWPILTDTTGATEALHTAAAMFLPSTSPVPR